MAIKAKKMTADDAEAYLLSIGGVEVKGDELRTPEWREECRYFLRIETYDDANIPVPIEDEILDREYGTVIMPGEAREG